MIGYCAQLIAKEIKQSSQSGKPLLLVGERGTGKELGAQLASNARGLKLFTVNCSLIPESLRQSILFGHKKGSFTGALTDSPGLFKQAENQALLLDELDKAPDDIRYSLLRYLCSNKIEPVGGKEETVNVYVIGTCQNITTIEPDIVDRFSEQIYLPPLKDRITIFGPNGLEIDILYLVKTFLVDEEFQEERKMYIKEVFNCIKSSVLDRWLLDNWDGNIRVLKNVVLRITRDEEDALLNVNTSRIPEGYISIENIPQYRPAWLKDINYSDEEKIARELIETWLLYRKSKVKDQAEILKKYDPLTRRLDYAQATVNNNPLFEMMKASRPRHEKLEDVEREHIKWILQDSGGNIKKASERLGIDESTIHRKLKEYGLKQ